MAETLRELVVALILTDCRTQPGSHELFIGKVEVVHWCRNLTAGWRIILPSKKQDVARNYPYKR